MSRPVFLIGLMFLAGPATTQDLQSFTPSRPATAPTFINAEVTRVDATTGLVTFRSESGDVLVTGGREVTAGMSLHPGDKVLVAFQEIRDDSGRQSRVVTEVRSASPGSGGLTRTAVAASTKGNVRAVRVLRVDRPRRTVTVFDQSGRLYVVPVRASIANLLSTLNPGDTASLTLAGLVPGGTLAGTTITGIVAAPAETFGLPGAFPPLTGTFVALNPAGTAVTLKTTGGLMTFPISETVASSFRGVSSGSTVSLNFDVTTGATSATVTSVAPATLAAAPVAAGTATTPVTGTAAAVTTAPGAVVATGVGPTSPYSNPVPSLQSAAPVVTAVLPPAGAKTPTSDTEATRAQGMRDLDASAVALAAVANDIDAAWSRFKTQCLKDFTTTRASGREFYLVADGLVPAPTDDQCRMMYSDLAGRVKGFQGQLDIVEAAARKADLLPADVREVFDRHRLTR